MKKLYTNDIQSLYRVISSIANLKQLGMNISSYGEQMFALKNELVSMALKDDGHSRSDCRGGRDSN